MFWFSRHDARVPEVLDRRDVREQTHGVGERWREIGRRVELEGVGKLTVCPAHVCHEAEQYIVLRGRLWRKCGTRIDSEPWTSLPAPTTPRSRRWRARSTR